MRFRIRTRSALLASALALAPLVGLGCMGASDDKLGSGNASKEGSGIDAGPPIQSTTQQNRNDKGDNPGAGTGTGRPATVDASKTGGIGETHADSPPGPGDTGPRSSSAPSAGPK